MPSVYDGDAFDQRVKYAVECIIKGRTHTRHFDTCFEMADGDAVSVAVYRRSLTNPKLRERIWSALSESSVMQAVERLKDVPTRRLPDEARKEREQLKQRMSGQQREASETEAPREEEEGKAPPPQSEDKEQL